MSQPIIGTLNMIISVRYKHLIPTNPEKVGSLNNKTWESQIPKRPTLRLYDKAEEEGKNH